MASPAASLQEETDATVQEEPSCLSPAPLDRKPEQDWTETEVHDAPPSPKGPTMCGVCAAVESKYKCSRCYLPYCSVACNRTHQSNHPPDPEPELSPPESPPRAPSAEPEGTPNLFGALDKSDKLEWLFRKYPNLPEQLLDIYNETQPPQDDMSARIPASLMRGVPSQGNWSCEKGISKGKAALRRARQLPGEAGEAIREYCTLIMLLVEEEEAKSGAQTVFQQQLAEQDANMIRQLMAAENGGDGC
ncbi:hypothetical protein CDD80_340 [Ophiocordyceps camponoti-rufipedis]|uniref:HIT-type domain-containing protein n=1 Tax=Ophiocordyceps camponoti-rufipedis TaxID=2004952 RepID=A0A2C5YKF5_9HYPO|nr:hypothetical protein CDD80_340 [Ophiocordyceps camponoti-rufipedis]